MQFTVSSRDIKCYKPHAASIKTMAPVLVSSPTTRFQGTPESYVYYSPAQVKQRALSVEHQRLFDKLARWANTALINTPIGRRCRFPLALEAGAVSFAVCNAEGYSIGKRDEIVKCFNSLREAYLPALTPESAKQTNLNTLVLALPNIHSITDFSAIVTDIQYSNPYLLTKKGQLMGQFFPEARNQHVPFPLLVCRYLVPTDWPLLAKFAEPDQAKLAFNRFYGKEGSNSAPRP